MADTTVQQNADGSQTVTNPDGTKTTFPVAIDNTTNSSQSDANRASKNLAGGIALGALIGGSKGAAVGGLIAGLGSSLNKLSKIKGSINTKSHKKYFDFCGKWHELFAENEKQIKAATNRVKDFYLTTPNFKDSHIDVMDTLWFRMRVLDIYLWGNES